MFCVTIDDFEFIGCSSIKKNIAEVFCINFFCLKEVEVQPVPSHRMSNILTYDYVRVESVATTADVQGLLEIPATDEIHIIREDRNHGLAWTIPNNGILNTLNSQQNWA